MSSHYIEVLTTIIKASKDEIDLCNHELAAFSKIYARALMKGEDTTKDEAIEKFIKEKKKEAEDELRTISEWIFNTQRGEFGAGLPAGVKVEGRAPRTFNIDPAVLK